MHILEVSTSIVLMRVRHFKLKLPMMQVELHISMLTLVLVLDPSSWMTLCVLQVLANCWNVQAVQS